METVSKVVTVESIGLPTAKKEISSNWVDQKFLMFGQPKVGKTKFFGQDENAFFVMTERGHNHVSVTGVEVNNYEELMSVLNKLVQAKQVKPYPYSIVVIDTFDRVIEYIEEAVIMWGRDKYKNNEVNSVGDVPNGAGWAERTSRVNSVLRKLDELKGFCASAVIMHRTIDRLKDEKGEYDVETVNVGGKSNKAITGWADHIMAVKSLYVGDSLLRKIKLRPTRNLDAGSRGTLPAELDWAADDKLNFTKFRGFFK